MDIAGKAAVVTGAARGVGRATALRLAEAGCSVLVNYRSSQEQAEQTADEVANCGVKSACFGGDVVDDGACREMMQCARDEFGRLDVLVNNAGMTRFIAHSDLEAVDDEAWDRILAVNLKGPFQCSRAAVPFLREAGGGEVVNVASIAGLATAGSSIPYGASKAALINMTINLARVLGPGIRVNSVAPGFIEGDWLRAGLGPMYEKGKAAYQKKAVLGNVCQPADVAAAIVSLIIGSDQVTGQTLVVDSGFTTGPAP